jgi:phosphonate transport system substrate-binding protein
MHRIGHVLLAVALASCAAPKPVQKPFDLAPAPAGTLTVGLIVSSGTATAQQQADALAAFVGKALEQKARAAIFPDYDTLASWLAQGKIDLAYMPPLAYVRATAQAKVIPLAKAIRGGQDISRSVFFAAAGSPLKSLEDLKKAENLKVAWVDPSSATGYIFPKALLLQKGVNPAGTFVDQSFLQSHDAVCKAVMEKKADVGASYSIDPAAQPVKFVTGCKNALGPQADGLQIVAATEPFPNDVLALKGSFPEDGKAKLLAAVQELEKTEEGKKVLQDAFHADGFTTVADEDYIPVRAVLQVFKQ